MTYHCTKCKKETDRNMPIIHRIPATMTCPQCGCLAAVVLPPIALFVLHSTGWIVEVEK